MRIWFLISIKGIVPGILKQYKLKFLPFTFYCYCLLSNSCSISWIRTHERNYGWKSKLMDDYLIEFTAWRSISRLPISFLTSRTKRENSLLGESEGV